MTPSRPGPFDLLVVRGGSHGVDRSGFLDSGSSDSNRLLERHETPGNAAG